MFPSDACGAPAAVDAQRAVAVIAIVAILATLAFPAHLGTGARMPREGAAN